MNSFYQDYESNLQSRGFTYGGGRISPDQKYFYLNIPKNANSYLDQLFGRYDWKINHLDKINLTVTTPVVILRDPVERWISGIVEYILGSIVRNNQLGDWDKQATPIWNERPDYPGEEFVMEYNDMVERLLFEQVIFDDHTMPQYYFFDTIKDNPNVEFFYFDKTITERLNNTFGFSDIDSYANKKEDEPSKLPITKLLKERLSENPGLQNLIKSKYKTDYEIINRVKFQ